MRKQRANQTRIPRGQLEFSYLLCRINSTPSNSSQIGSSDYSDILPRTEGAVFSEGFLSDEKGNVVGVGLPPKGPSGNHGLDEDARDAIAHQDHERYLVCLLEGAPTEDPLLAEMSEADKRIIRRRERRLNAQETRVEHVVDAKKKYRDFLNEVEGIRSPWRSIPQMRDIVQRYFPTSRNLENTKDLREYVNERIRKADRATGREVRIWRLEQPTYVKGYQTLLRLSGEINPNTDVSRMQGALKESFPRFGGTRYFPEFKGRTQVIEGYSPEEIRHIYTTLLDRAINLRNLSRGV